MTELKQVYTTEDGKQFEKKADALNYLRRPKILEAMMLITANNAELSDWLVENQETVEVAFESGTIKRVTKSEAKKLEKALIALTEIEGNTAIAFLQANADAIKDSFRWPSVKRMTPEEKITQAKNVLVAATDNADLADWVIENKDKVVEAYKAGIVKRVVSEKAKNGLQAYRDKMAAKKKAKEASENGKAPDDEDAPDGEGMSDSGE